MHNIKEILGISFSGEVPVVAYGEFCRLEEEKNNIKKAVKFADDFSKYIEVDSPLNNATQRYMTPFSFMRNFVIKSKQLFLHVTLGSYRVNCNLFVGYFTKFIRFFKLF